MKNRKKLVIVNRGSTNRGKSHSITEAYKQLFDLSDQKNDKMEMEYENDVVQKELTIEGYRVIFQSWGDPYVLGDITEYAKENAKAGYDIVVTASRSYGNTVDLLYEAFGDDYEFIFVSNDQSDNEDLRCVLNKAFGGHIVKLIMMYVHKELLP